MAERSKSERRRGASRLLKSAAGIVVAAALLAWVLHDVDFKRIFAEVRTMDLRLIAAGLGLDILSYALRVFRWQVLFRPLGRLSYGLTFEANYAGMFLNEILPVRVGEAARAIIASRSLGVRLARIIPSMAVERLLEGIWLALGVGVVALAVPLPKALSRGADILGAGILLAVAAFVVVAVRSPKPPAEAGGAAGNPTLLGKLRSLLVALGQGFREIGLDRKVAVAFGITLPYFLLQALAFWVLLEAYHVHLSLWSGAAVFLIVHLGSSLPSAPANVGSYQFACVVGLTLFGIDKTTATGFSIVAFLLLTASIIAIGFVAFLRSGLSLAAVRKQPIDLL